MLDGIDWTVCVLLPGLVHDLGLAQGPGESVTARVVEAMTG